MIASPHNEKLKLVRKLRERKHREREGLFVTEGEDLVEAGLAAGAEPRLPAQRRRQWPRRRGGRARPAGRGLDARLGYPGDRGLAAAHGPSAPQPPCVYLHGVADPGNVGAIVRTAHALLGGSVVLGPDCADPFSPKAVRASMGSVFAQPLVRAGVGATPRPRVALVAHGGEGLDELAAATTLCLGAEREGLPDEVLGECDLRVTIPLRRGAAESLNVAAAAAIACERVANAASISDSSQVSEREP